MKKFSKSIPVFIIFFLTLSLMFVSPAATFAGAPADDVYFSGAYAAPVDSRAVLNLAAPATPAAQSARKVIYVLPGFLGSELYDSTSPTAYRLWPDIHFIPIFDWLQREHQQLINNNSDGSGEVAFAFGKDIMPYGKDVYGALDMYKTLVDRLKNTFDTSKGGDYDIKFFPYNWLGDINETVKKLEADAQNYDKIVMVTHSTGGLVASAYVSKSRENRLKVEKLIMIAPPLYGTYAALFPLENGNTGKGFNLVDIALSNKWVKQVTHNSPTVYQLLPAKEYFSVTPALDLRTKNALLAKNQVWTNNAPWSEFYRTLNGSANINTNLLSAGNNPRSHISFREKSLTGEFSSIMDNLLRVNTTVIGVSNGESTPKTAQYDVSAGYNNAKLIDVKYDKLGDGTIYHTSLGITLDAANNTKTSILHTITYSGSKAPNHIGLIKYNDALNDVVRLIREASGSSAAGLFDLSRAAGAYAYFPAEEESDQGMVDYVKLRVESDQEIITMIFDAADELVAYCDAEFIKGFDSDDFICDQFGGEGETITSIYLPKQGYTARFYLADQADDQARLTVRVYLLDEEGDYAACGVYNGDSAAANGEILALDMREGVTIANIDQQVNEEEYPESNVETEVYETEWSLDLSGARTQNDLIVLNNIGDTAVIGISGDIAPEKIEWSSYDEGIITVKDGALKAQGYGATVICASATDGSGKVRTVEAKVSLASAAVSFADLDIVVGEREIIQPQFDSELVTEVDVSYEYDSDAISIEDGVIIGQKTASVQVTGIAYGGVSDTFTVNITNPPATEDSGSDDNGGGGTGGGGAGGGGTGGGSTGGGGTGGGSTGGGTGGGSIGGGSDDGSNDGDSGDGDSGNDGDDDGGGDDNSGGSGDGGNSDNNSSGNGGSNSNGNGSTGNSGSRDRGGNDGGSGSGNRDAAAANPAPTPPATNIAPLQNTAPAYAVMKPTRAAGTQVVALKTRNSLILNSEEKDFPAVNIDGYNWLKLRDVAILLAKTSKQFSLSYDPTTGIIDISGGGVYQPIGDELLDDLDPPLTAIASLQQIRLNGQTIDIAANNIKGYNYLRLRDLAILLDFAVDYDDGNGKISLDLTKPYWE